MKADQFIDWMKANIDEFLTDELAVLADVNQDEDADFDQWLDAFVFAAHAEFAFTEALEGRSAVD